MSDLIEGMNLPWKDKPKRGGLLRAIGRIGDIVKAEIIGISRAFHPFLCDAGLLPLYAAAVGIPKLEEDTEDELRERISTAGFFLGERGHRGQVYGVLDRIIPGRYEVFEAPKDSFRVGFSKIGEGVIGPGFFLAIKVRDLIPAEKARIYGVLDSLLDPDIEIIIVPWITSIPANITLEQIRLYGGSRRLGIQYKDIGDGIDIRILPDDAFRIGDGRIGYSVIWGDIAGDVIRIHCPEEVEAVVTSRSTSMYHASVNWEVISE